MSEPAKASALARLVAGQICIHAAMAGTRMAAPLYALKLGHGALEVGGLLALFSLMQVFLAVPAGRFADQHGLKRPVGIALVFGVMEGCSQHCGRALKCCASPRCSWAAPPVLHRLPCNAMSGVQPTTPPNSSACSVRCP